MGRIKTILIKRTGKKLVRDYDKEFSEDFNKNKKVVSSLTNVSSKKMRNTIAGYVTRLMKQKASNKLPSRYVKHEDLSKYYN